VREDQHPAARVLRWLALGLAFLVVLPGVLAVALYAVPRLQLAHPYLVLAASFIPYGVLAWVGTTILIAAAARGHAKLIALLTVAGLLLQVAWARPYWPVPTTPDTSQADAITVMSINLRCDGVGLEGLGAEVARVDPDILVLQGADPETRQFFEEDGRLDERPNRYFYPLEIDPDCGKQVLSRHPIEDVTAPDGRPTLRVTTPSIPLILIPVDVPTPLQGLDVWEGALTDVQDAAVTHLDEPALVIGDFNAVLEHLPLRRMLRTGFADAASHVRPGWRPTFPADRGHPPAITIDHALVSPSLRPLSFETFRAGINAHLGITVRVVWRP